MSTVVVRDLVKVFGPIRAVDRVSCVAREGEVLTLLGPSGCGKTTILRCLAGLEDPDGGTIDIGGRRVFDAARGTLIPAEGRNLGMVFQSYAIWPHLTVFDNVAFGLRVRGVRRREIAERVRAAVELVRLSGYEGRYPAQLSGGQQQRVVLARCLAYQPGLLLLDEPLANLDAKLRDEMRGELRRIQRETRTTMVYVTHDQAEALSLSHQVLVMDRGRVIQRGTPLELYRQPAAPFVADFLGSTNRLAARVGPGGTLEVPGAGPLPGVAAPAGASAVTVCLRPADVRLVRPGSPGGSVAWPGTVEEALYLGDLVEYRIRSGTIRLTVRATAERDLLAPGAGVALEFLPERALVFAAREPPDEADTAGTPA